MKKLLGICMAVTFIAIVSVSCQKECVCEKTFTNDDNILDTIAATTTTTSYSGGHDYDKRECESLSYSHTTSTSIPTFTCGLEEKK